MASMSYCAVENTVSELQQIVDMMEESSLFNNEYEARNFEKMLYLCEIITELVEGREFSDFTEEEEY